MHKDSKLSLSISLSFGKEFVCVIITKFKFYFNDNKFYFNNFYFLSINAEFLTHLQKNNQNNDYKTNIKLN